MQSKHAIVILAIAITLFLLPLLTAEATNTIAANTSSNSTSVNTAATWTEYENLTIATGAGNVTAMLTVSGKTNYSMATMYGRIKRDGAVIESFNLTSSTYTQTVTYVAPYTETAGTHYYAFEAYCTTGRTCTIYNRTFSVNYLATGSYVETTAQTGLDALQNQSFGNNDTVHDAKDIALGNNDTAHDNKDTLLGNNDTTHDAKTAALQANDTADQSYVNNTFVKTNASGQNITNATNLQAAASYIVYWCFNGAFTCAKNGSTWELEGIGSGTDSIQFALDTGKPYIKVMEGTYAGGTVTFAADNQTLEGVGRGTIIHKNTASNNAVYSSAHNNITLKNLVVDANETGIIDANKRAVYITGTSLVNKAKNIVIDNVEVRGANKEIMSLFNIDNLKVTNVDLYSYQQTNTYDGLNIYASDNIYVDNANIWSGDDSIVLNSVRYATFSRIHAFNGTTGAIFKIRHSGTSVQNSTDIIITEVIGINKPYGILVQIDAQGQTVKNVEVSHIDIYNASYTGIQIDTAGASNNSIDHWRISDAIVNNPLPLFIGGTRHNGVSMTGSSTGRVDFDGLQIYNTGNYSFDTRTPTSGSLTNFYFDNPVSSGYDQGLLFQGSNISSMDIRNGYINATTAIVYSNVNAAIVIENVNVSKSVTKESTFSTPAMLVKRDNYGLAGYNWGTVAMTSTLRVYANGANDWVTNSSRSPPFNRCVSTTSGDNWINSTDGGQC